MTTGSSSESSAPVVPHTSSVAPNRDADTNRPSVPRISISQSFAGEKLDHLKSNWRDWSDEFHIALMLNGLDARPSNGVYGYTAFLHGNIIINVLIDHEKWHTAWDEALGVLLASRERLWPNKENEQKLLATQPSAKDCWDKLKSRHENEGPVRQLQLLSQALSTSFTHDTPLPSTAAEIQGLIERAFAMGDLTYDVVTCLALLQAMGSFPNLQTLVNHNISLSTKEKPYSPANIISLLENEQRLMESNKSTSTVALAARTTNKGNPRFCSNCKKERHTADFCIAPGGGMAGKSLDDVRKARRQTGGKSSHDSRPSSFSGNKGKIPVRVKDADGRAFTVYLDSDDQSANNSHNAFAGLASDDPGSIPQNGTSIEYEGFMAVAIEEERTSVDWSENSKPVDLAAISTTIDDNHQHSTISLEHFPFYCDTGATTHISPEKSDFISLRSIPSRTIKGVGGSAIAGIAIGDIKLKVAAETCLTLKNVLFVPASTVRLISVQTLAKDSNAVAHFDESVLGLPPVPCTGPAVP
ncbi:hypothetical protein JOM56_013333 [Amanita muscaria]